MAEIIHRRKALAVSPLKVSQPVGASLAFLGLARAMPLEHGARGCTSFNKLFFMRHFQEPIALQTTAMDQVTTVIGADDNVIEALATIACRQHPDVIGLIGTALSETQGADIPGTIQAFRQAYPHHADMAVIAVSATDTLGCLETGFALAMDAIVDALVPTGREAGTRPRQINLLVSQMLTPTDIETLRDWIERFGLDPIILPDIADSLDGHLVSEGYRELTYGGTPRARIAEMGRSVATLVVGPSLAAAALRLQAKTGVPNHLFAGLMTLDECDDFVGLLARLSGKRVPAVIERQRAQYQDALVDCHFMLSAVPVAIAADADLLGQWCRFITRAGGKVSTAVASAQAPSLAPLPVARVMIGDLDDFETDARTSGAQILITNSHGKSIAERLGVPLLRAGYPQYDQFGAQARGFIGYRGMREVLFAIANLLSSHYRGIAPYHSLYRQTAPGDVLEIRP